VAGNYPIVFYAHTANVDVPLLFWVALAVAATLQCAERGALSAAATAGVAAAMAVLTKEQSMGALIVVPLIWLLRRGALGALERGMVLRVALTAGIGFVVTTLLVGNVWWNPMGFINRWRFLLGILPPEVRDQYAPYQFQVQIPKGLSLTAEFQRLLKVGGTVEQALTPPVLVLCLAGAAWAVWQRPRAAAIPLAVIVSYYTLSLRATALIQVRYTMPLLFFALLLGGAAGGALMARIGRLSHRGTRRVATALVAAAVGLALLPGIEISRLLVHDPRYVAEAWLREHVWPSARVEIYERPTYLPRFNSDVQVVRVPVEERTLEGLQQRQPDFVVLSSGGRAGLTGRYVRNWEPGKPIIVDLESAKEFFDRLRSEQLGYRRVGHFQTPGRWITPRINSVNPEITIYARQQASDAVNGS
jgi:hypothetical protein